MNGVEREALRRVSAHVTQHTRHAQTSAWMRLFTKVNTILVGRRIPVDHSPSMTAPAATDGNVVTFSTAWLDRVVLTPMATGGTSAAKLAIATMKGINYHEVAHCLFSPSRVGSPYAEALQREATDNGFALREVWGPANHIEDQRIEGLFAAAYPGSRLYFRAATTNGLLKTDSDKPSRPEVAFFYTHGRRYLPKSLRRAHRTAAIDNFGPEIVDRWTKMMDEYVGLTLIGDADRAAQLVIEATRILRDAGLLLPPSDHNGAPGKADDSQPNGADRKRAEDAAAKVRAEVAEESDDTEPAPAATSGDDKADEDGEDGEGQSSSGKADADATDEGEDGEGEGAEGDADGGEPAPGTSEGDNGEDGQPNGENTGSDELSSGGAYSDATDEPTTLTDTLTDLMSDATFNRELDDLIADFRSEAEKGDVEKPKKTRNGDRVMATAQQTGTANRLHRVLQQMRADAGTSVERHLTEGRLNVLDFASRNPWEIDVFSHVDEGHEDEFNMEVVVLLDMSPSMRYLAERASLALWQIKYAMQQMGVPVTAYGYNDGKAKCLYAPADRVTSSQYENFGAGGYGTDPLDAMHRAYNVLSRSSANRRILITITDGEWNGQTRMESDAIVQRINGLRGATSIIIGLTSIPGTLLRDDDRSSYHCHQIGREVNDPVQILDVFKDYVYSVGRKASLR